MVRSVLAASILAAVFVVDASTAEACSPPLPGFTTFMPSEGATVPSNAVWFVRGYEIEPVMGYWLDFDVFLPLETRQVGTLYELHNTEFGPYPSYGVPLQIFAESGNPEVEPIQTEIFIDDEIDRAVPQVNETFEITAEYLPEEPGLCQPGGWHVQMRVYPAADQYGIGAYHMYEVTGIVAEHKFSRLGHVGVIRGIIDMHAYEGETTGRRCYLVEAVDFAGNTGWQTEPTCIELGEPTIDAGVMDAGGEPPLPDAGGTPVDAGTTTNNNNGSGLELARGAGCGCEATEGAERSGAWLGFAMLLVSWGYRRRRSCS